MKKALRSLAAVLAVSAVIANIPVSAYADNTVKPVTEITFSMDSGDNIVGGWAINTGEVSLNANKNAKNAFKKATKGVEGESYKAIALLGTQVVAGTNYAILCRVTPKDIDGGDEEIRVMYIYEDLQGKAEITGFKTIIGKLLPGGFSANPGKFGLKNNKTVYNSYKKAVKSVKDCKLTAVAYLGSQVVAGTNYLILCGCKNTSSNKYTYSLVKVYKSLDGKNSVISNEELKLGEYDEEEETGTAMVGIANPWQEYETVSAAAEAAGVKMTAPDKIGNYKIGYIQAMNGLAEVNYTKGKKTVSYRCGNTTDDNSGDYNEYEKTVNEKIGDITVVLRMNGSKVYSAIWDDGKQGYSYFISDGISKKSALSHIKALIEK